MFFSATSCQNIPTPPPGSGMIYSPDPRSNISLISQYTQWNPRVPFSLEIPPKFCEDNYQKLLILGRVKAEYVKHPTIEFKDTNMVIFFLMYIYCIDVGYANLFLVV